METKIKIGWCEESLTPDKNISLTGQFYERISKEVESPITVTALALESDGEAMVICSCDLTQINSGLQLLVKEKLSGKTDLPLDKIILHATHTHTSHSYSNYKAPAKTSSLSVLRQFIPDDMLYKPAATVSEDVMTPDEALEFISSRIAFAVKTAWETRAPAAYAPAFGRVAVGMPRRACYDDGTALMWGDTNTPSFTHLEGTADNGVEMLFTFDANKKPTGVVLNISCPAQVMEHRSVISADYWGKVKLFLRQKFGDGFCVCGLCAPAGDLCPRDLIRWQNGETPINDPNISRPHYIERRSDGSMFDVQGIRRIGKRIANEVFDAYDEIRESDFVTDAVMIHMTESISMPLRRVTPAEYKSARAIIEAYIDKNKGKVIDFQDTAAMHVYGGILARYEEQRTKDIFDIEVHFIRLGDITFATFPFELFLDYGNQIRARSLAKQTFLVQLACDSYSYLPTEEAEKGGHYSAYVSSGYVGHAGGELLVRKTLNRLNGFFKEK